MSPPQPTKWSGEASFVCSPSGVWGGDPAETHICVFSRTQNSPFCTYMPMLSVRQIMFHVTLGEKAEVWEQLLPPHVEQFLQQSAIQRCFKLNLVVSQLLSTSKSAYLKSTLR